MKFPAERAAGKAWRVGMASVVVSLMMTVRDEGTGLIPLPFVTQTLFCVTLTSSRISEGIITAPGKARPGLINVNTLSLPDGCPQQ